MSTASMVARAEWPGAGIGPARAARLRAAGYHGPLDLLLRAPRPLPPPPPWCDAGPWPRGQTLRVRGRVQRVRPGFVPGLGRVLLVDCARSDGLRFRVRFFRAAYLARQFIANEWYDFCGRSDARHDALLNHPSFAHCPQGERSPRPADPPLRLAWDVPEGFSAAAWQALLDACLAAPPPDPLGELDRERWRALLLDLHRPPSAAAWEAARRAVAWREALAIAAQLQARRRTAPRPPWCWDEALHQRILARLPFTLTEGQAAALAEIRAGLTGPLADARLLAGDVGSGKTALALAASLAVIAGRAQVAWLAPTAVLAAQHYRFVARCLADSRVRCALLTGATPRDERRALLAALAEGAMDLVIGTHALLEDEVRFARLGLAVIDEQQRFGTAQRAALVAKAPGGIADLLLTTATPIPRTLALTVYGDLAITRIAGRPPGQRGATVELAPFAGWAALAALVAEAGGPAFVVCPRIAGDGDDGEGALSVEQAAAALRPALGDGLRVLTGALDEAAKLAALADIAEGRARCLVATTVVEVGIDLPEAELVVVLDAQRFGLASLHQLRGRVGRGQRPGRCLLLTRGDAARLAPLADPGADGLAIAEADLAERGPGELLGLAQHGRWPLLALDLARDLDLLQQAHARLRAGWTPPAALAVCQRRFAEARALAGG